MDAKSRLEVAGTIAFGNGAHQLALQARSLGLLQLDGGVRDSLVYDVMEPIRPKIDAYVFDWISNTL